MIIRMSRFLSGLIIFLLLFGACGERNKQGLIPADVVENPASAEDKGKRQAKLSFAKKEHDFEKVIHGEIVTYSFKFSNTGNKPLLITSVDAACGCTVPEFPDEPVAPGEEEYIEVKFDSKNQLGFNNKKITVLSNAVPNKVDLHIRANVYEPGNITN
ncbi:MAG: DUF1573 domain-containing protein [Bacteroidales bacterium]